jgi:ATP-dependent DNA ligase
MVAAIVAMIAPALYEPGRRSGAWVKMRVNKSRELVVGRLGWLDHSTKCFLGGAGCHQSPHRMQ